MNNKIVFGIVIALIIALALPLIFADDAADAASATARPQSGLDKVLNFVIPIACFGFFFVLIYRAFKEPLDKMFAWIKEKMSPSDQQPQQSIYHRYKHAYMIPGDIRYQ